MTALDDLKNFNANESSAVLWSFRGPSGPAADNPKFSGKWIDVTPEVISVMKDIFVQQRDRIDEVLQYGLLAQNNEGSVLSINSNETHAALLVDGCAAETQAKKATSLKHIHNSKFYIMKFIHEDTIVYAVKKADRSWQSKVSLKANFLVFADQTLDVDDRPKFALSKAVDFFIVSNTVLIPNKGNFESLLRYREAHIDDFVALQGEAEFASIFSDMQPLVDFVGINKIQLRRLSAVKQKAYYRDVAFMQRLSLHQAAQRLNIQFDDQLKIVPTPETCSEIITVLLDHRLSSVFSQKVYDVQNTTDV